MIPYQICGQLNFVGENVHFHHLSIFMSLNCKKWHGKLNGTTLQMLLNCSTDFQAKKLG